MPRDRNGTEIFNPLYGPQSDPFTGSRTMPGPLVKMEQAHWSDRGSLTFTTDGGVVPTYTSRWNSPVFDLRPEFQNKENLLSTAIPVNRSPALGSGAYLRFIMFGRAFASDPAAIGSLAVSFFEVGNDQPPRQPNPGAVVNTASKMFSLSPSVDITKVVNAGGRTVTVGGITYVGGSLLPFSPPGSGIRFWQVHLAFNFTDHDPVTDGFGWQASIY